MKSMRQLINLMEGVSAVPGLGEHKDLDAYRARLKSLNPRGPEYSKEYSALLKDMPDAHNAHVKAQNAEMWAGNRWETDPKSHRSAVDEHNMNKAANTVARAKEEIAVDDPGTIVEKSTSEKQARFMAAAAHDPKFAKKVGMDRGVAKEFNKADTGTKQLSNAMKKKEESVEEGCAIEEKAPPGMEDVVMKLKKEYPGHPEKAFATAWSIYNKKHGKTVETGPGMEESVPAVSSCQQTNPATADKACAMEEGVSDLIFNQSMDRLAGLSDQYVPYDEAMNVLKKELADQGLDMGEIQDVLTRIDQELNGDDFDHSAHDMMNPDDSMDGDFDSAMASAGHGSDEDYGYFGGEEFEEGSLAEDFDLNNGYDDVNVAQGSDYFPTGADGPVTKSAGPSGARQGDNPEQKKMEVTEVHKELVYGYRSFLKESAAAAAPKKKLKESAQVSDIKVSEFHENAFADSDSITYDGAIGMSATVMDRNGKPVEVGYDVDVKAEASINWESDETPTGWNYKTDSPTYTSHAYAECGDITVTSVQYIQGSDYYINNEAMELDEFVQQIDPTALKLLLTPSIYAKALGSPFDKAAENAEPPEPDYHEPERDYDSRY